MSNSKASNGSENNTLHLCPMPVAWDFSKVREFVKNQCESQEIKNSGIFVFKPTVKGGQDSESVYIRFNSPTICRLAHTELQGIELNGKKVTVEMNTTPKQKNFKPQNVKPNMKENYNSKKNFNNYPPVPLPNDGPPSLETYGLSVVFLTSLDIQPPLKNKVYVSNIDWSVGEAEVRELMSLAGQVTSISMHYGPAGEPQGRGSVQYDHPVEAVQAISMLHGQEFYGRNLVVVMDKYNAQPTLPRGLTAVGMGLGPGGKPLKAVRRAVEIEPLKKQLDKTVHEVQKLSGENLTGDNFTPYGLGVIDNPNMPDFGPNMPPFMGPMAGPFMPAMNGPFMPGPNMPMGGPNMPMGGPNMPMGGPNMPMGGPNMPMGGPNMPMGGPNMPMGGPNMPMGGPNMPIPGPGMPIPGPGMPMPGPNMPMPGPNMPAPRPNMPIPRPNMPITRPNMRPNTPTPKPNIAQPTIPTPVASSMPSPPGTSTAKKTTVTPAPAPAPKEHPIKIKQPLMAKPEKFSQSKPEKPVEKSTAHSPERQSKSKRSSSSKSSKYERPSTSRHERSSLSKRDRRSSSKYDKSDSSDDSADEEPAEAKSAGNKDEDLMDRFQQLLKGRSKPTLDVLEGFMDQVMNLTKTVSALREIVPKEDDKPPTKTRVSKWSKESSRSPEPSEPRKKEYSRPEATKREEHPKIKNSGSSKGSKGSRSPVYGETEENEYKRRYSDEAEASTPSAPSKQRRIDEPAEVPAISSDMLMFTNLPPSLSLTLLSDKMRGVGALRFAELTGHGRAIVRFHKLRDAQRCIQLYHRSKVDGQIIEVQPF